MAVLNRLSIDGKFLTAKPTGVHRVAEQLIVQLARHKDVLASLFPQAARIICPPNLRADVSWLGFNVERRGILRGQLWEQLDLPRYTGEDLLLNLCNLGPIANRAAITMIHDAQVYITPTSYTWAFRTWYRNVLPVLGHRHLQILAVSKFSADQLAHFGVAPRERIAVIPNGVDHLLPIRAEQNILTRLQVDQLGFVVGLANTQAHKNVGLLLKAFADPALGNLRLVLVGAAGAADFEAEGHYVAPNVIFTGRISDGELRALLEAALCVGFPSTTEGFGLPPLEGMSLGCPAILAPCGALPEVGGDAVMYASPKNPGEWITAIRQMLDDPTTRESYSRSGIERAKQFTWKRSGELLLDVICKVVVASRTENLAC